MFDAMNFPFFSTMSMGEPAFINFGNLWLIVKDMEKNTFHIWSTNKWHHICLSFDRLKYHLKLYKVSNWKYIMLHWWSFLFFKDGHLTNIDLIDHDILKPNDNWLTMQYSLNYNSSILDNFYLGRTEFKGNSDHSGQISDFHVWDRPLNGNEMEAWTTCK